MIKKTFTTSVLLKNRRIALIILVTALVTTGCAGTGKKMGGYADNRLDGNHQITQALGEGPLEQAPTVDVAASFRKGNESYGKGNLDEAERYFRQVLLSNPHHDKATYNMSMIYLRRAYDGFNRYASLEIEQDRRQRVRAMLEKLNEIGSGG